MSKENKDISNLIKELQKSNYNVKRGSEIEKDDIIRTDIFALDYVLGGGIPVGEGGWRAEFFGPESSCKTTFALLIIAKYQKLGKTCVFIDAENSYDAQWGEILGIDNKELVVIKPGSLEEMGDTIINIIPKVDMIVIDSIVSLLPENVIERETNQPTMASSARVNAVICGKIYSAINKYKTSMIFINQMREKVGVMYGSPNTTSGGHALKHLYNFRLEFRTGKPIEAGISENETVSDEKIEKKEKIGIEINLTNKKNKKGKPYLKAVCDFYFTGYIDNKKSVLYAGIKYNIINLSGKTYTYKNIKAVGKDAFMALVTDDICKDISADIWKRLK